MDYIWYQALINIQSRSKEYSLHWSHILRTREAIKKCFTDGPNYAVTNTSPTQMFFFDFIRKQLLPINIPDPLSSAIWTCRTSRNFLCVWSLQWWKLRAPSINYVAWDLGFHPNDCYVVVKMKKVHTYFINCELCWKVWNEFMLCTSYTLWNEMCRSATSSME